MSEVKCKLCTKSFTDVDSLVTHIESKHSEQIPKDMTAGQYYYFLKTGKSHGSCVICKDLYTPSLIAREGTTIINLVNPYFLLSSNIVLKYT